MKHLFSLIAVCLLLIGNVQNACERSNPAFPAMAYCLNLYYWDKDVSEPLRLYVLMAAILGEEVARKMITEEEGREILEKAAIDLQIR